MDALEQVRRYHQETKHHFYRYARALGYMDWANQPDPFRRFAGAALIPLPVLSADDEPLSPAYEDLYVAGAVEPQPVSIRTLSRFFEYALAISAWKEFQGTRWALRSNPSSGNLHPTESYLFVREMPDLSGPALYHYAPKEHALESRMQCSPAESTALLGYFPPDTFLLGLSSIHWREAWKYGERAFRYCQHDTGHAIGAVRLAAATLGWQATVLGDVDDETVARLLGLDRTDDFAGAEREHPDCLIAVWPATNVTQIPLFLDPVIVKRVAEGTWFGKANRLSREEPVRWDIIEEVASASWKSTSETRLTDWAPIVSSPSTLRTRSHGPHHSSPVTHHAASPSAGRIIRRRRSAVALDGTTTIKAAAFFRMMTRVMPARDNGAGYRPIPWDGWPWEPRVHLGLFVHLVEGIPPGLYVLVRDPARRAALQKVMHEHFAWVTPQDCPATLPLYLLQEGDARQLAAQVSCHQAIAGDGAFSLGMLADYDDALRAHGAWYYRRLYWETGALGQVLYLEAEAEGIRATGIGCFFDDPVHRVFGLADESFQSLYHFTAGGAVDDPRLTTLPAYEIQP